MINDDLVKQAIELLDEAIPHLPVGTPRLRVLQALATLNQPLPLTGQPLAEVSVESQPLPVYLPEFCPACLSKRLHTHTDWLYHPEKGCGASREHGTGSDNQIVDQIVDQIVESTLPNESSVTIK
jgi:hypothetical protein